MSQQSTGMLGVAAALYGLTLILPADKIVTFYLLCIVAGALVVATILYEWERSERRAARENVLRDIQALFMQGREFLFNPPSSKDPIDEWEKRLGAFLNRTLGSSFQRRLLTAGFGANSRVMLYLSSLDKFTAELNSSSFDMPIKYDDEAKRLAQGDTTLGQQEQST